MDEMTTQYSPSITAVNSSRADASGSRRCRLGRVVTVAAAFAAPLVVWAIAVPIAVVDLAAGAGEVIR
jgi:hypothetical protein